MMVLEARTLKWIKRALESATLKCKQRDINTPEVKGTLDLLEPHISLTGIPMHFHTSSNPDLLSALRG